MSCLFFLNQIRRGKSRGWSLIAGAVPCLALIVLVAGCATRPKGQQVYSFFPPPPDEPRVQFLAGFSSDRDLNWNSKFVEFVTGKEQTQDPVIKPYGVDIHDGTVFVCDTMASAVRVFDLGAKKASVWAPPGEGRIQMPINVTIDTDGTRYLADTGRGQVMLYRKDGQYIGAIGAKDEMKPCDVVLGPQRLYIADLAGHAVRVYNKADRKFLFTIPRDPKNAERKLLSPTNLAMDSKGRLIVSDTGAFAVQLYDTEGNFIQTIGQQGVAPGMFARPKGVAADREGRVFIVDAATQVVQVFDPNGKLLMFFGQPDSGQPGSLHLPAAVKIDYDNVRLFQDKVAPGYRCEFLILVTSQVGGNKVNVFGFVKKMNKAE